MGNYDFTNLLSPIDFELLSKDLLEAELKIQLENFREGRDGGIDLRYAPAHASGIQVAFGSKFIDVASGGAVKRGPELIVQCKRYATFASLKSQLKNQELPKILKLKPARYILTTSAPLSPQQSSEIQNLLSPFLQSTGDVFGRERLNSLLSNHPEVERRHIKLWVGSAGILDSILNAGTHGVSREEVERTVAAAKIYVRNSSFDEALTILKEHRVCIISGLPGIGKTTLARMLLLYYYERKFDIVKIESDISEARAVGYHRNPRFYYYDDFLGQSAQADKLNKNEDQKLLDFMRSVRDSKESVMVLTTREYILNQAKLHYEKLDRERFDHKTCVIDLSKYSRRIRAQILYNHLHFSELPRPHLVALVESRGYFQIVDHENYNPRLIEYLTSAIWVGNTSPEKYLSLFLANLDNPVEIWEHSFRNQLSDSARHLLVVLTSLPTELILHDVESAFVRFHKEQCLRFGISNSPTDFKRALKELDGTFVATRKLEEYVLVRFQNPSIRDFLQNLLLGGEWLAESLGSVVFFEQAQWFSETLSDERPRVSLEHLFRNGRSIKDAMRRLIDARSCSISVAGKPGFQKVYVNSANEAERLAKVALALFKENNNDDLRFINERINSIAEKLEAAILGSGSCVSAVKSFGELGHLNTQEGRRLVAALKSSAMNQRYDLDEFETLAKVFEVIPGEFSNADLGQIREAFAERSDEFGNECENGYFDIDDPEVIRTDAARINYIGDKLGVDTKWAEKTIRDYADKKEREADDDRDSSRDDDDDRFRWSASDHCSDGELDSMFGTLGE